MNLEKVYQIITCEPTEQRLGESLKCLQKFQEVNRLSAWQNINGLSDPIFLGSIKEFWRIYNN